MGKHFNVDEVAADVRAAMNTKGEASLALIERCLAVIERHGITTTAVATDVANKAFPGKGGTAQRSRFVRYVQSAPKHEEFVKLATAAMAYNAALAKPDPAVRMATCYDKAITSWLESDKKTMPEPAACLPKAREAKVWDRAKLTKRVEALVEEWVEAGFRVMIDADGVVVVKPIPKAAAPAPTPPAAQPADKTAAIAAMFGVSPEKAAMMAALLTS